MNPKPTDKDNTARKICYKKKLKYIGSSVWFFFFYYHRPCLSICSSPHRHCALTAAVERLCSRLGHELQLEPDISVVAINEIVDKKEKEKSFQPQSSFAFFFSFNFTGKWFILLSLNIPLSFQPLWSVSRSWGSGRLQRLLTGMRFPWWPREKKKKKEGG